MKDSIDINLDAAFNAFAKEQTQEAYEGVIYHFFMGAKHGLGIHVPIEENDGNMVYGLIQTTAGYYYDVCTSAEQLALCPKTGSAVTTLDKFVAMAANDYEVGGVCLNPYSSSPCFIPREYILRILGT